MEKDYEVNEPLLLMRSFWQLHKKIMMQAKQTAIDNDLSIPQFAIMIMMHNNKEIPQKKLQTWTRFPKSTLSYAIEGLVQAGLIYRKQAEENRREVNLSLSDHGKAFLREAKFQDSSIYSRLKSATDTMSKDQFNYLIEMHQYIASFFESGEKET